MDKVTVLLREVETMPEALLDEVIDFAPFLIACTARALASVKAKRSDALDAALLSESALAKAGNVVVVPSTTS
jgi:hypothetical protein